MKRLKRLVADEMRRMVSLLNIALLLIATTGAYAQGTWTPIASPAPDINDGVMLLLTDGTVMAKTWYGGYGSTPGTTWDRLTPDAHGSYVNGTWSTTAPMNYDRLYFSTWVLNDGRVYVGGGEYGSGTAAEIYNPVTNGWSVLTVPGANFADGGSENLTDGRLLLAVNSGTCKTNYLFDPASNGFTTAATSLGNHDEASWLKLPDGSILQVDFNTVTSERYIPATNQWVIEPNTPVSLYDNYANEMGAALMLPDGRGFFIGGTGHTLFYTPSGTLSPGTWTPGPDLPDSQAALDAPAAMMANGKLLIAVSPKSSPTSYYPHTSSFYEFDYLANTYTRVNAPNGSLTMAVPPYYFNMLTLPDGNVLVCDQADYQYYVYSSPGTPITAGKPTLDSVYNTHCDTFRVTGKLFTGISEGAAYGDDWSMASNYPVVRLTSGANVYYARSLGWNRYGTVMTGALPDTALFVLPYNLPAGTWAAQVVVNGNASAAKNITKAAGVSPMTATICQGSTVALTDSAGTGTWSTGNATIATVGTSGTVTGISAGTTLISCTVSGCASMATITVNSPLAAITGTNHACLGQTTALSCPAPGGTWSSSNNSIATVADGVVNGIAAGAATITYSASSCSVVMPVTVNALPSTISGTFSLCQSTAATLSSSPSGGSWSSSNTALATIGSNSGSMTGTGAGNPVISYTLPTGCARSQTVTVNAIPSAISGSANVCLGLTGGYTSTPSGGTWSSNNILVATIGLTGLVTGVATGGTTISYVLSTGCKAVKNITVNLAPAAITGSSTVCTGSTTTLSDASTGGTWTSSATAKATIGSATGIVSGVSAGNATITYTLPGSCKATKAITVSATPAAITGTASVCSGSATLLADATPAGTWHSATTSIATVGSSGSVTGLAAGTDTVSYTLATGCTAIKVVTVNPLPAAITGGSVVCVGGSITLSDVSLGGTWSSSAPSVATIGSSTGLLTGVAAGTVVISYTTASCGTATAVITVSPIPAPITGALSVCTGASVTLADAVPGGTWGSSNPSVATVGSSGAVTGTGAGVANINYSLGACGVAVTTISVSAAPAVISGPSSVCSGSAITLTDSTSGGIWSASNPVATVVSGIVSGIAAGTATITYSTSACGFTTKTVSVFAAPSAITGVTALCVGTTSSLGCTAPGGTWTSCNPATAVISATTGVLNGMAAGTSSISYSTGGGCIVVATVTVNASPAPFTSPAICVGTNTMVSESGGGVWSSANTTIATADSLTGIIWGVSAGGTAITYTLPSGCYTTGVVTVSAMPAAILGSSSVFLGGSAPLSDAVTGGTWASSDTTHASIDRTSGVVTGLSGGVATITYATLPGCIATTTVAVLGVPAPISGLSTLCEAATATLYDASAGGVWTSSNTAVATVSSSTGIVTGVSQGSANITYLVYGVAAVKPITVIPLPAVISGAAELCVGSSIALTESVGGGTWSSSGAGTVTVGSGGGVAGVAAGVATIFYTTGCGTPAQHLVTVHPLPDAGTITGSGGICVGSSVTLSESADGGIWSATPGETTVGSASGVVSGVSICSDLITYTATSSYGCVAFATKNISVAGVPGNIYTIAGNGTNSTTGDGGPAHLATLQGNRDIATDNNGNIYFTDVTAHLVRRISASGIITTVAGNGLAGNGGDGGPATAASLNAPMGVYADGAGNLFIANTNSHTVRKVDAAGIITTIAGIPGVSGATGDGGPASAAKFYSPAGMAEDDAGNLYICDQLNYKVRKIAAGTGIITTVVGTGSNYFSGDGGLGTAARLSTPRGLAFDKSGNMYIADGPNGAIRKYNLSTKIVTTVAGIGAATGYCGDGGPGTAAKLCTPARVAFDGGNSLYITDMINARLRRLNLSTGTITTVAGTGVSGFSGDGAAASSAQLGGLYGVACGSNGNIYITDANNRRIRVFVPAGSIAITLSGPSSVPPSTPVTFTASAFRTGPVSYQWQKNGVNTGTDAAVFTDASPANGDVYRCLLSVSPECGSSYADTSNSIAISVASGRPGAPPPAEEQRGILLYPNPCKDVLTLSAGDIAAGTATISVFDRLGKEVLHAQTEAINGALNERLNMSALAPGLYLGTLTDYSGAMTRFKFVKE